MNDDPFEIGPSPFVAALGLLRDLRMMETMRIAKQDIERIYNVPAEYLVIRGSQNYANALNEGASGK